MGSSNKKKFQPVSEKFKSHKELLAAAVRGWEGALKLDGLSYLIPQSDVVGQVPSELEGTFFRNGPGLNEVYGKDEEGEGIEVVEDRIHVYPTFTLTRPSTNPSSSLSQESRSNTPLTAME